MVSQRLEDERTGAAPENDGTDQGADREVQVHMISLGCPKNLVDSEMMLGNLFRDSLGAVSYALTTSAEDADVIIVNTCGFIDSAKEESINTILEACELKNESETPKRVVVAGCLAQRYGDELREEVPEVDAILGLGEYDDFSRVVQDVVETRGEEPVFRIGDPDKACHAEVGRFRLTPQHYAYIKMSEGCDNPCTFCAIPAMRGRFRSKSVEMVVGEARELVASGAREINLIAQDTTSYGIDLYDDYALPRLLDALAAIDGLEWIRVLYAYPAFLTDAMLDSIANNEKVVNYLDMPLQHIANRMLRHMGRRMMEEKTRELLQRTRERVPGIYLRTTFIVGFPGETEEDFETLREFVGEFKFERLGVFPYSDEEGTPAEAYGEKVPEETRAHRLEALMLTQQQNAFAHNDGRRGERVRVLVDRKEETDGVLRIYGRSFGEAPEIDPSVILEVATANGSDLQDFSPEPRPRQQVDLPVLNRLAPTARMGKVRVGQFIDARITGRRDYDLLAAPV